MTAPKYERVRALEAAIQAAVNVLDDPIDRIEVRRDSILVGANSRQLILAWSYQNAYAPDGAALPGSGHWFATVTSGTGRLSLLERIRAILK